ncbi:TVP38/TMEM64 family protein [Streptococcus dysgalactiae subsp. dysgalactiae]|uniref:TVP38/TMEM64 family membrane protein n=1 Tax=Streptococcus dysgalactiae subsp. equisimilis TaxID=119602 RepID=A0AAE9QTJ3_STREQ|nr:VTT domain-containing protein [Streptococcus dysgalactiae]KKC22498.1 membrane protein [Streptococcus dysgalactiae subsp. equisimilis]MBM6513060.1 TVP38/TMEM64 family protein [Streptococcus dysgalactiae subsp. equisimilis]MBM6534254.1 TVP38/TMEM64 family protein [Streptococcus dysgalactiae subsp. equisimilis]MBM6540126.1 TVP38/TMEM64 family protein [Streptococcus dysgalactiae subsp. equisimilis]MCY7208708.1 VTT domain-containing protein [Streptococcus dysgalactiae]
MPSKTRTLTHKQTIQILTAFGIALSLLFLAYFQQHPNFFAVGGTFQAYLVKLGILAPCLFILIQIVQVVYPVIPGGLTCVLGHVVFGPFLGFIYNTVGIFIGSLVSFMLARKYGAQFAKIFVSDDTYNKYIPCLDKGKYFERFLAAAFILPGFPDDFLCMVAGLGKMSLRKFTAIFLLAKPVTLYIYTVLTYQGFQLVGQVLQS